MMLYKSKVQLVGPTAPFPEHTGERVYMRPFKIKDGLPEDLIRWQDLISSMLVGVETDEECYLMIDQAHVEKGSYHRRPGVHIDGYWSNGGMHRGDGGSSGWRPIHRAHIPRGGGHGGSRHSSGKDDWGTSKFDYPEAIILASNEYGCDAYEGLFEGPIGDMGNCENVKSDTIWQPLHANRAYAGNVTMLHASVPADYSCDRTVVRINTPGWSP